MTTLDELVIAFPGTETRPQRAPSRSAQTRSQAKRSESLRKMSEGEDWHNNMIVAVGSLVQAGLSDEEIQVQMAPYTLRGYTPQQTREEVRVAIDTARDKGFDNAWTETTGGNWPTPFQSFDETAIPRREWIYGWHYIRGYVSVVAAPGGLGKTSLQVAEALAIVTGRDLLGEKVRERTNVWLINAEDPRDEMDRRVAASMKHHKIDRSEVENRLFIDAGRESEFIFARQDRDGVSLNRELVGAMIDKITKNQVGLVFVDPFVGVHGVNENDNMAINAVVGAIRKVADTTGAAIVLVHHTRKANGTVADVDSIRGAGSVVGAARAVRVLNRMSEKEANDHGIDEEGRRSIFRVDECKGNLAKPADKAVWRRMKSVRMANGDTVGVVEEYNLRPGLMDLVAGRAGSVQAHLWDNEINGRQDERAEEWIGFAIADHLEWDVGKGTENRDVRSRDQSLRRTAVKSLIRDMIDEGKLLVVDTKDRRSGRDTKFVRPVEPTP